MKKYPCNPTLKSLFLSITLLLTINCLSWIHPLFLDNIIAAELQKNSKIHITADKLSINNDNSLAEFSGNVKASQGNTVITADHLQIYYNKNSKNEEIQKADSIQKIVISGNVTIKFDNRVAVTHKAVYIVKERILILSGKDTAITSGKDSISGKKITLYRDDGRVSVEGGIEKQVTAIIHSDGNGLQ